MEAPAARLEVRRWAELTRPAAAAAPRGVTYRDLKPGMFFVHITLRRWLLRGAPVDGHRSGLKDGHRGGGRGGHGGDGHRVDGGAGAGPRWAWPTRVLQVWTWSGGEAVVVTTSDRLYQAASHCSASATTEFSRWSLHADSGSRVVNSIDFGVRERTRC